MKSVKRLDLFEENFEKVKKTDAGFLRLPIRATRVGIFKYLMPDGKIRRELRPPEEVFNVDSMETLAGVPITVKHPSDLVTTKNFSLHSVGMTGDNVVATDKKYLDVFGTIAKERAVKMIEDKMDKKESQEVSCGYTADIDETPGVFNGETYDVVQRNIRYNHIALVDRGRAGSEVKLRLDEDQGITYDKNIKIGEDSMEKEISIDGIKAKVDEKFADAFEKMVKKSKEDMEESKSKMKKAEEKGDELAEEIKTLTKEKDTIEAKKDSLEDEIKKVKEENKPVKMDADQIDALVEERSNVCSTASEIIGEEFKKDGLSNLEIKKQVIAKINPDLKLDEKSEDYIAARFDSIAENTKMYEDKLKKAIEGGVKKDGVDDKKVLSADEARKRMIADSADGYKQPLTKSKTK